MNIIQKLEAEQQKSSHPKFRAGDTVRIHTLIKEGEKERIQIFEGVCIRRNGGGAREMVTIRKISSGVGVERVFPLQSPRVAKIEVKQRGRVRRNRLYYLRSLSGKAARIAEEFYAGNKQTPSKSADPKSAE